MALERPITIYEASTPMTKLAYGKVLAKASKLLIR